MTFYDLAQIKEALYEYQNYLFQEKRKVEYEIDEKKIPHAHNAFFISREVEEEYNKTMRELIKQANKFDKDALHLTKLIEKINEVKIS